MSKLTTTITYLSVYKFQRLKCLLNFCKTENKFCSSDTYNIGNSSGLLFLRQSNKCSLITKSSNWIVCGSMPWSLVVGQQQHVCQRRFQCQPSFCIWSTTSFSITLWYKLLYNSTSSSSLHTVLTHTKCWFPVRKIWMNWPDTYPKFLQGPRVGLSSPSIVKSMALRRVCAGCIMSQSSQPVGERINWSWRLVKLHKLANLSVSPKLVPVQITSPWLYNLPNSWFSSRKFPCCSCIVWHAFVVKTL